MAGIPRRPRALIVEDDPAVARALARAFRSAGWDADVASEVREALARLGDHAVAVVDLELPDGSGLDMVRAIRGDGSGTRVAICTGRLDGRAVVAAAAPPVQPDAFFQKPLDFDRLMEWVDQVAPPPPPQRA